MGAAVYKVTLRQQGSEGYSIQGRPQSEKEDYMSQRHSSTKGKRRQLKRVNDLMFHSRAHESFERPGGLVATPGRPCTESPLSPPYRCSVR